MSSAHKKIGYKKYDKARHDYHGRVMHGHQMRYLTKPEIAAWFTAVELACKKRK